MDSTVAIQHEELARESGELLPARQTLDLINLHITVVPVTAVNLAIAVNAATISSSAHAMASQAIYVTTGR